MDVVHRDDVDNGTRAWWDGICHSTTLAMQDHVMPYVTPISSEVQDDDSDKAGCLEGTGSYLAWKDRILLITNEHVVREWETLRYGHQFQGCEDIFRLDDPLALEGDPVDAAVCAIDKKIWSSRQHTAEAIPETRIAKRHEPVPGELLFLTGFPGARSKFYYGTLISPATRLLTQALPADQTIAGLHANYFPLVYAPARAESVDPKSGVPLSLPPGLSGSLIWNTRRVECEQNKMQWSPDIAKVTGMLCSWIDKSPIVIATRIEALRDFLTRKIG